MAPEVTLAPRAESNTLRGQEESLRAYLADRLGIRTRIARLPGARALLVSGPRPEHPKGLVIDDSLTAAERIYLYVHLAAHVALRHNVPVMTIVEPRGEATSDAPVHRDAEELARAMWWGLTGDTALAALLPSRRSRLLRALLGNALARTLLRTALLGMRYAYYRLHMTALAESPLTAALRRALCVTAVVCVAPQLARARR
jgi:hypothetical protein